MERATDFTSILSLTLRSPCSVYIPPRVAAPFWEGQYYGVEFTKIDIHFHLEVSLVVLEVDVSFHIVTWQTWTMDIVLLYFT